MNWYSSKVRLVCLIEGEGGTRYMDSVYLFRARDFEDAHQKALNLGKSQEEEHLNCDKRRVVWKLKELISLDIIKTESLDGVEVYSEPVDLESGVKIPFNISFKPEKSSPTQTI